MANESLAPRFTQYSLTLGGLSPEIVSEDACYLRLRCGTCGKEYSKRKTVLRWAMANLTATGQTCSRTCGTTRRHLLNPEAAKARGLAKRGRPAQGRKARGTKWPISDAHRAQISKTMKERGLKPVSRGGNGTGMTPAERLLAPAMDALGLVWNHPVSLGKRQPGYPTNYKLDFACPIRKVGLEVDGNSHRPRLRQEQDRKKEAKLAELGWLVFRMSNAATESLSTTSPLSDILTTLPEGFLSTIATT